MVQTDTAAPLTGSIADVAERLALWGRRAPKGLARVEFVSDFSRQEVVSKLRTILPQDKPLHEIELPFQQPAIEVVHFLRELLRELSSGVVSITGFATAFADDCPLADSLRVLNFHRDNLAQFPLCQIWWMPRIFAETFLRSVPDLTSWFMLRLRLTDVIIKEPQVEPPTFALKGTNPDEARHQASGYAKRFEEAIATHAPANALINLAVASSSSLYKAGLEEEERALIEVLLGEMAPSLKEQGLLSDVSRVSDAPVALGFVHGIDYYGLSQDFRMLAQLYERIGRVVEAEELYWASFSATGKAGWSGMDDANFAFQALAQFYLRQHRYIEVERLCKDWLLNQETISGPESFEVLYALDELVVTYLAQGQYEDAEPLYYRMLAIAKETSLPDASLEGAVLDNLANLYKQLGRYAEAEAISRRRAKMLSET